MSVLDGYLKSCFGDEGAKVDIETQSRNGEDIPVEIAFESAEGHSGSYRFMLADVINQQLKTVKMKEIPWDVTIVPTQKNLKDLGYFNGVLGDLNRVIITTESGVYTLTLAKVLVIKVNLLIMCAWRTSVTGNGKLTKH